MTSQTTLRITGLKNIVNPIYWDHLLFNQKTTQIFFGGSSSGKSYAIAQRVVIDLLEGRNYLVLRKVASTLRRSVFNEIEDKINSMGLRAYFKINKSDMEIQCTWSGSQIIFAGLDDAFKVQSIKPKKGVITDIWIEEATEITYRDYKILLKRLRGLSKVKKRFIFSFNPILKTSWIFKEFFIGLWEDDESKYFERDDVCILKTTYKDNKYLTQQDIDLLENEKDPYYYNVYTLGNWGILGAIIYKNWVVEDFDKNKFSHYRNGLDWGYENPFAFLRIAIEREQKKIYICEEIYQSKLTNDKSGAMVKKIAGNELVWCDSAEPKSIKEYRAMGIMAKPAEKGKGSILEGIKYIHKFQIIIHPSCVGYQEEISQYKRREDKDGNVLEEPIGKNDHLMDAKRYALEYDMKYGRL